MDEAADGFGRPKSRSKGKEELLIVMEEEGNYGEDEDYP